MEYGEEFRDNLMRKGMEVTLRVYEDRGHWVNEPEGIDDLFAFIDRLTRMGP